MIKSRPKSSRSHRRGTTLLEVLLASAVFFAALAVITQTMQQGTEAALRGELEVDAAIRCKKAMAEALQSRRSTTIASANKASEDKEWETQVRVVHDATLDIDCIEVRVTHRRFPQFGQFVLSRLVADRDPLPNNALAGTL